MAARLRTKSGTPSSKAREIHGEKKTGRFPIFDRESANSALRLRGHSTTKKQRSNIISRAAKFAPNAAKKARVADRKK